MEFGFSAEEEKFRDEIREWLREKPPAGFTQDIKGEPYGSGGVSRDFSRWQGSKALIAPEWPLEYGGQGRSAIEKQVLVEELTRAGAPWAFHFGSELLGPCILRYGTEEQKKEWLPKLAMGVGFCESFSETEAGSDLGSTKTRATEEGDSFAINGQKIWSSYAHLCRYCFLAAITDPEVPTHKGTSLFLLDLDSPGVTVSPITEIGGATSFAEIFFDNVKIPLKNLLGEKNKGWFLLLSILNLERSWSRSGMWMFVRRLVEDLAEYARNTKNGNESLLQNPLVRQKLAQLLVESEVCRLLQYRVAWMLQKETIPEFEASMVKLYADELCQRAAKVGTEILGVYSLLREGNEAPLQGRLGDLYLRSIGLTIAAGTSEIQKNIIAHRGLKLPRE